MKKWVKDHKALIAAGSVLGVSALVIFAYFAGKKYGEIGLTELLIKNFENGDEPPVVTSRNKNLGNLMYELRAECIGD